MFSPLQVPIVRLKAGIWSVCRKNSIRSISGFKEVLALLVIGKGVTGSIRARSYNPRLSPESCIFI